MKPTIRLLGLLLAGAVLGPPRLAQAQTQTLEFATGAGNPSTATVGPTVANQVITFQTNTDNPAGTNFIGYTPTAQATFALSNQQYTLPTTKIATGTGVSFGGNVNQSGQLAGGLPVFPNLNFIGSPVDANFSSAPNTPNAGIGVDINKGVEFLVSAEPLPATVPANARYQYADLTITFSQPIANPVLNISALGATYGTFGFTTEFNLLTTGVTLSKLSGSQELTVSENQILNNDKSPSETTGSGAASGSVLVSTPAAGITSVALRIYLRPNTLGGTIHSNGATHAGDGWALSISTLTPAPAVTGYVYEDVHYGGGAGRPRSASGTVARPNARVELYSSAGFFVAATTTDANGFYSFAPGAGTYTVRVVSGTVTSSRPGAVSSLVPVQTYNGTPTRVGGEAPEKVDAGTGTTGTTLASLNTTTTTAESQATMSVAVGTDGLPVAGPDFGYNFDLVVNTNDAGQGSLRQFIINSNALTSSSALAQVGSNSAGPLQAGKESSIFMIPSGAAVPGQLAGLVSGLNGSGVAAIAPTSALPAITGGNTTIDGTTQTFNIGNTNNVTLGTGGTVGTRATALGQLNGPEVQLRGTRSYEGLSVTANNATIRGLSIYGFTNNIGVGTDYTGLLVEQNVLGTSATSFTDPGANVRSSQQGIYLYNSDNGTVRNNLIGFNGGTGVWLYGDGNGANNNTISGNEIRGNALEALANGQGLVLEGLEFRASSTGNTASGNLITGSLGNGIDTYLNTIGGNTITGNTISNNGQGVVNGTGNEGSALRIYSATNPTVITNNILSNNNGSGMLLVNSAAKVLVSQNAIFGNARVGIDLLTNAEGATLSNTFNGNAGTTTNVTLNSAATTGANGLLNYPVLTSATLVGTNLLVKGYAKGTALIEFFTAQPNPSAAASPNNLFGQGAAYLANATEGTADADTRTGLSYSGSINGFNQGSDTNANGFSFLIPLTAAQQLALTAGTLLTSTATLGGATSEFSGNVRLNSAPVPATLTNVSIPNNFPATVLNPNLSATANGTANGATNTISYYSLTSLPTSGTLTYNGTVLTSANIATTQITPALLGTLTYTPDRSFVGSVSFGYTATDANGATSTTANNGGTVSQGPAVYTIPVIASADVTTTISGPGVLAAGQPSGTFTATFTNNGPSDAANVTQTVTLPSGATLTPAQQLAIATAYPGTSFGSSNTVINFPTATTLAVGASVVRQFAFTAPAGTGATSITSNVGTATSQGIDAAPNSATLALNVVAVADVATTISPAAASVALGTLAQFNVTFSNVGAQNAAGVVGKVQLPLGLNNVMTSAGTYDLNTGVITYNIGSLGAGSAPLALTVTYTQPANGSSVTATAAVSTTSYEAGQTANNSASATINPLTSVDVATVIGGPATTTVGAQVTYNVTTSSVGTATATNVGQTVTLPSGATNIFVTGGGVISGSTVTFPAIAALAVGQSVNNTVSFTAPNTASLSVVAGVTATDDSNAGNNASTATTTTAAATSGSANLYTTITPSATNVAAGTSVTFTVTQGNQGPNAAASVVNRVALPIGLPIAGAAALKIGGNAPTSTAGTVATYGSGATASTYDSSTGIVAFASIATQAVAATPASYTLTFNAPASGVVVASSTVAATTPDGMLSNNVASTQVTIDPAATDVATTLTGPDAATPGQRVTFAVTTTNNGPVAATNVVQTVVIPAGLPIVGTMAVTIGGNAPTSTAGTVATYANGATYNSATGVVTFATLASQTAGNTVSTIIAYAVPANGDASLVSTARVTSTSTDRVPANNAASVATTIQTSADVQVALSGPGTAAAGALVSYGVTTTNNGPSVAAAVSTTVQLPAGLSRVTVIGFDGTVLASAYNSSTGLVTFPAVSSQAAGATSTGSLSFAAPNDASIITPTATATVSGTTDPTLGNNSATVATTLTAPTGTANDLAVTLGRSTATAPAGSAISFSFAVTNNGSTPATGVVATVQLPAGLPIAGANALTVAGQVPSSTSGTVAVYNFPGVSLTYNSSTGLLVSTGISLNAGATAGATISIPQAPGTGPVVATATVRGDQPDADLTNNLATQSIAITAVADVATAISGPGVAPNGGPVAYTVVTSNAGLSPIGGVVQAVTLPAGIMGYSLNGTAVGLGSTPTAGTTTITLPTPSTLAPGAASTVANTISFVAPTGTTFNVMANVTGTGDTNPANNVATQTTTRFNAPPVATNVTNTLQTPEGSTATVAMLISPLAATSATSTIKQYNLSTVVPTAQGVLYYDNSGTLTAITTSNYASLNLSPTQAATLRFLPAAGYVGNATFTYTATDNNNLLSNVATYLIPVGLDNSSVYTNSTQVKGGSNKYANNDVLAYVVDSNTAQYNSSGQMYAPATGVLQGGAANGLASAGLAAGSNALPAGVSLNPTTGQLYVSDAAQLVNNQTAQTYTVRVTTTDLNGGTNTQNVTFTIGAYPLPVTLVAFTAQAVQNRDALLNWSTASEINNDHFEIERSFDGTSFVKIGQVAGHGTTTVASAYALTDAGVAAKATGPVYYRLRQVDYNGTSTYSPVRSVSFTKLAAVSVGLYPNPAQVSTGLDLHELPATGTYQVTMLDATGRTVRSWALGGGLVQPLDVSDLATGAYHVRVSGQQADGSALHQVLHLVKE